MKTSIIIPLAIVILAAILYFSDQYEQKENRYDINLYRCKKATTLPLPDSIMSLSFVNENISAANVKINNHHIPIAYKTQNSFFLSNTDTDALPDNLFLDFICIERLYLNNNKFKKIPLAIKDLPNLYEVRLRNNEITALNTTVFETLYTLNELDFSNNPIQKLTIPSTKSELIDVRCLNCELTEVDSVPPIVIKNLNLSNNKLSTFPIQVFNLERLNNLDLSHNNIQNFDLTPAESQRFIYKGLYSVDLFNNELTQLPEALCKIRNLKKLNLNDNNISGKLITKGLTSLEKLELSEQSITDVLIKNVIYNEYKKESTVDYFLPSMIELNLDNNKIKTFEVEGGTNTSIATINLHHNQLKAFPKALHQFKRVKEMNLSNNAITSVEFLEYFGEKILNLDLSHNQIKKIYSKATEISDYDNIDLSYNQLTKIPGQFLSKSDIIKLDLSHNKIRTLNLGGYAFEDIHVEELDLSNNPIKKWDSELIYFKDLKILDLSNTEISDLPIEELKRMPSLETLIVKNTKIPDYLILIYELSAYEISGINIISK